MKCDDSEMAVRRESSFCTDEELLNELKKLGYNDISPDLFQLMKDDLIKLVSEGEFDSSEPEKTSSSLSINIREPYYNNKPTKGMRETRKPSPPATQVDSVDKNSDDSLLSDQFSKVDISFSKYKNCLKNFKMNKNARSKGNVTESNKDDSSSTDLVTSSSSLSIDGNRLKRKVLRHRNGKPVITEEFLDIPHIFSSSYPETLGSSAFSDDVSFKTNDSTGSASALSPDQTPRSTLSLSSTRSTRGVGVRKKKNDPVAMYNYYKKFWDEFKPPGEKTHDKLRWAVRDRMLDYNL